MSSYRGTAEGPDQAKAIAAVIVVHAALAAIILTGLNVRTVRQAVERLTTIDIKEPPPPPPPPPPRLAPKLKPMKEAAGAPAPKTEPTPVVAPPPKIPVPSPIPAAKIAGAGASPNSGASTSGTGTGAGGTGNGPGGGGDAYAGYSPPGLVRNLGRGDYRMIAAGRLPSGAAMVSLRVEPTGLATNCRVVRSSGDPYVDAGLCPLIEQRLRFRPAMDNQGRPIPFQLQYVATWRL
jgi:periplasmic protein TonB